MRYPSPGSTHSASVTDAALFVAEDFIGDLEKVVDHVFIQASMNTALQTNIEAWTNNHPPIVGNI